MGNSWPRVCTLQTPQNPRSTLVCPGLADSLEGPLRSHLIHPSRALSALSLAICPLADTSSARERPSLRPQTHPGNPVRTLHALSVPRRLPTRVSTGLRGPAPSPGREWHVLPLNRWVAAWCLGPGGGHLPASPSAILFHLRALVPPPSFFYTPFLFFLPSLPLLPPPPPLSTPSSSLFF